MYPEGGPKDVTPAKAVFSRPQFYSTNFNSKKIVIRFNEFIQLSNKSRVIISPPMYKPLDINLKGKSIYISFNDTLRSNTTYNINFSDVVRDYTEGNISENFQYIFSTGNEIDTIFVSGKVFEANTGKPAANIQVGLYFSLDDSIVVKQKPDYYAITNKEGFFSINNIKGADYKIFALKDNSNDMLFNKPEEWVGFLNEKIVPQVKFETVTDTFRIISEINIESNDTLFIDSLVEKQVIVSSLGQIDLRLFEHDYKKQYIKNYTRRERYKLDFVFNREPYGEIHTVVSDSMKLIQIPSEKKDSLVFLLPDNDIAKKDTLIVFCSYLAIDSIGELYSKIDTLKLVTDKTKIIEDTMLNIKSNIAGGKLEIDKPLQLFFNHPVIDIEPSLIGLFQLVDTIKKPIPIIMEFDSTKTVLTIKNIFKNDNQYELSIDSLAITDLYSYHSDFKSFKFSLVDETAYGILTVVVIDNYDENTIFELTGKNNEVVWRKEYPRDKIFTINNLKPGNYSISFFVDENKNKKRDTGSYFDSILPEFIVPYHKDITIKANWDTEIEWKINK